MAKPLNFVGSIPQSGATNVSPNLRRIKLMFDKNVVNDAVWENNRKQILMYKGARLISIRVRRIKDTVDFSERRNIYVYPVSPLASSTNYKVKIKANMMSKAGETLGKTVVVTFKTGKRSSSQDE